MTDIDRGEGGSPGPPWSVDLLADLQAGALDPETAAELWQRVTEDAEARAVLEALEATQSDLRELVAAPAAPMPAHFAARLDAAIAAEAQRSLGPIRPIAPPQQGHAPVVSLDEARRRRTRRLGWGGAILTAAAAAVAVTFAITPGDSGGGDNPPAAQSTDGAAPPPLAFKSDELGSPQLDAAKGKTDLGPLSDKQKLGACLTANGLSPTATPLGGRQVTVDGKPGVLVVLAHGLGEFRLLVLAPDCGPDNPGKLAEKLVGGVKTTK